MSLLEIKDLTIQFGGLKAVSGVSLSLEAGQERGLSIRIQREDIFNAMHRI